MNIRTLAALLLVVSVFSACKKDKKEEDNSATSEATPSVRLNISNQVDGTVITTGDLIYTNEAGEPFGVSTLKYYFSYATLVKDDGTEVVLNAHKLVDAINNPGNNFIAKENLPEGTYTSLKFSIGVDETHNHTGAQEGDLDPINGMLWTWNTGYIFFKHEGQYQKADQSTGFLTYHWATDAMYQTIELPLNMTLGKETKNINLVFNLNDLYRAPNLIAFEGNDMHQSLAPEDHNWLDYLKTNFLTAFSVASVQ